MKVRVSKHLYVLGLMICFLPEVVIGQINCKEEFNYSISNVVINGGNVPFIANDDGSSQITLGESFLGETGSPNQGIQLRTGMWSYFVAQPQSPIAKASQGEYVDRIEIEWDIVDDKHGPPVTGTRTKILRNGRVLTTVPIEQTAYVDFNVFAGEFYTYEIVTTNEFGDARPISTVGFLNPNGRVTGKVETQVGAAAADVKVVLSPNLGLSLDLDGVDDYAYFVDQGFEFGEYYTIEGWWRNTETKIQTIFIAVDSANTANVRTIVWLDDQGRLVYAHDGDGDGNATVIISEESYNTDAFNRDWHHFAAVRDTTTTFLYVDGSIVGQVPTLAGDRIIGPTELEFGKFGPNNFFSYFAGQLDDFRVWGAARSTSDIRKYKDITLTGEEQYLDSYWKFDEQFGETLYDLAAEENVADREHGFVCDITRSELVSPAELGAYTDEGGDYIIKGIYYGEGTTFKVTPSKSTSIGYSLEFDGVDDYLSFDLQRLEIEEEYTLEFWLKTDQSTTGVVFQAYDAEDQAVDAFPIIQSWLAPDGRMNMLSQSADIGDFLITPNPVNDERWHHFALTQNATGATLYLDGMEVASNTVAWNPNITLRYEFGRNRFNDNQFDQFFDGLIDEVRVWDHARTNNQITSLQNQVIPGDEQGVVDENGELGLLGYWPISAGQGELVMDVTPKGQIGKLVNYQTLNVNGQQLVTNWEGGDIPLKVEFFTHDFDPNARNITLDPSNTSVDDVDFTDISQLGVSGFVRYDGTDCFAEGVEILVNGESFLPPVFTDEQGLFTAEFEPGSTSQFLSAKKGEQTFAPGFIELPRLVRPIAGLSFDATTKRSLEGSVVGGHCGFPIGGGTVTLRANNGCFERVLPINEEDGSFEFEDLPPLAYNVSVSHNDLAIIGPYFDAQGGQVVDLISKETDSLAFIYYAPTEMRLAIENTEDNPCSLEVDVNGEIKPAILLQQNQEYDMNVVLFQQYGANECYIEDGIAVIDDGISFFSPKDTIQVDEKYTIKAGNPNVASPFTKKITVTAKDEEGQDVVSDLDVVVLGFKTLENTFQSTTPDIPFMILRDPPGDASYSYLEENSTTCTSFSFEEISGSSSVEGEAISMGLDLEFATGLGFEKTTTIDLTNDLEFSSDQSNENGMTFENQICLTNSSTFTTNTDDFTVGSDGDVYVGGAFNVLIGTNRILQIDTTACGFITNDIKAIAPTSFATTYIYSEFFIKNNLIPSLEEAQNTESVSMWNRILNYNETLKQNASFVENLSFTAGANLDRSTTSEQSESTTLQLTESFTDEVSTATGVETDGVGITIGISDASTSGISKGETDSEATSKTVGYVLGDADLGDNFTVDILRDAAGIPVFRTLGGESSCPWEPDTQTRTEVGITALTPTSVVNVPEDEVAEFRFAVSNISETAEDGFYAVRVVQESNPFGAVVAVNGVEVEGSIDIYVRALTSEEITVTVEKGPSAFEYNDLQIEFFVPCELEKLAKIGTDIEEIIESSEAGNFPFFFVRQSMNVEFTKTCSDVEIQVPEQNWVINSLDNGNQAIVIDGYDLALSELNDVRFQYRMKGEGSPYINDTILTVDANSPDIWSFNWNTDQLDDGMYEIRAVSQCQGDFLPGISEVINGTIDRQAPSVLGEPSPLDAVLSADDEISITFNESINCESILSIGTAVSLEEGMVNNVALVDTELGLVRKANVTCSGDKLIIVPDIQNKFLEGRVMRVDLLGIEDIFGNVQTETISWEFRVDRDPLEWIGGDIQSVVYEGESPTFTRQIKNNGAFAVNVNLSGALDVQTLDETLLPSWISATPRSFSLPAGGTQEVTFTVNDQLSGGDYQDVVTAATSFGAPELRFDVRVLCPDPGWSVDASDFENSMTFTGQLDIRGDLSTDEFDIVAAYVGNELRGVGQVQYAPELENIPGEHPYLVFMTLYTNSTAEEMIDFQVWDASRCQLYGQIAESYAISLATTSIGSPTNPATVKVTNDLIQNIPLSAGWNWFSLNLNTSSSATNNSLSSLANSRGDIIKSRDQFSQYVEGLGWAGSLTKLDSTKTFRIRLNKADTLVIVGEPIDFETTQIQLDSGWNWISFLPPVGMELNEALSSITATADFIIKSQTSFAQYVDFQGWIGSLDFLRPNEGYLIFTDRSATLEYPVNNANARIADVEEVVLPDGWFLDETFYEFNSNHILRIDGIEVSDGDFIGLFKEDQLLGWGRAKYLPFKDKHYFFVTSYSNEVSDELDVRIVSNDVEIQTDITMIAKADQMLGSVENPIMIDLSSNVLGLSEDVSDINVYPNPFDDYSVISLNVNIRTKATITLSNLAGQVVNHVFDGVLNRGAHEIRIERNVQNMRMASGVYLLHIESGNTITTRKLIVR